MQRAYTRPAPHVQQKQQQQAPAAPPQPPHEEEAKSEAAGRGTEAGGTGGGRMAAKVDFNPFLFIKNKWLFISSEDFSPLEKKCPDKLSEGNAAHPVRCGSSLQIVMAVWRPFCLISNFLGGVQQPYADNNGAPKGHYYLQRAVTPDQITQQNSLQRAGAP